MRPRLEARHQALLPQRAFYARLLRYLGATVAIVTVGLVIGVRNLTEEQRVADHLGRTEKLAAIGELVAGVAHELNNPLTGISTFAQLLLGLLDEQQAGNAPPHLL